MESALGGAPRDPIASAADRLRGRIQEVVDRWVARVASRVPAARSRARPILVDSLHLFLGQLADALDPGSARRDALEGSTVAQEHGSQRVRFTGYRLDDLLLEYQLLRQVVLEVLEEEGPVPPRAREVIVDTIDRAVTEASGAYVMAQATARERFMAQVAHDLRGPLSSIHLCATMLVRQPAAADAPRWASRITELVASADRMIGDLLDASRVDAGHGLRLDVQPGEMGELARRAVEQQSAIHGGRFTVDAPAPVPGHWSGEAIVRAIENLLSNAVKYGEKDAPITVSVAPQGSTVTVAVHNLGSYIDAAERGAIFEAFHRADAAAQSAVRGWGLGLSIVRGIAEAHGGSLTLDSDPQRGTTFSLTLPLDARPFQPGAQPAP